jgi:hypothetical protein
LLSNAVAIWPVKKLYDWFPNQYCNIRNYHWKDGAFQWMILQSNLENLNSWCNFCVLSLMTDVTTSPYRINVKIKMSPLYFRMKMTLWINWHSSCTYHTFVLWKSLTQGAHRNLHENLLGLCWTFFW